MTDRPDWTRDPDVLEEMFHAALTGGDTKGVAAALTVMAGCDLERMVRLADELKEALAVVRVLRGEPNNAMEAPHA